MRKRITIICTPELATVIMGMVAGHTEMETFNVETVDESPLQAHYSKKRPTFALAATNKSLLAVLTAAKSKNTFTRDDVAICCAQLGLSTASASPAISACKKHRVVEMKSEGYVLTSLGRDLSSKLLS